MVQLSPPTDWVQHWTSNSISFGLITKLSRFYYGTTIMEPAGVQVHGASPSCGVSDWWLGYNIWIFVSHEVIITVLCQHIPHIFALVLLSSAGKEKQLETQLPGGFHQDAVQIRSTGMAFLAKDYDPFVPLLLG
jgi:hypothetical protein